MAEETGRGMNEAFIRGSKEERGMGEALAVALDAEKDLAHPELSLLLNAWRLDVPVSVHAALGAEIIHQHPVASGAAIGDTSHRDFRRLAASIERIDDGGVVLNLGSAVIMPEVFLKALTIARNVNAGAPRGFVTCDLDMQRHYRPHMNVVQRPTLDSGKGYEITGHHEIMVPLLAWAVIDRDRSGRGERVTGHWSLAIGKRRTQNGPGASKSQPGPTANYWNQWPTTDYPRSWSLVRSGCPREPLPQPPRRPRTDDRDHDVRHRANHDDLQGQKREPDEQPEDSAENPEHKLHHEKAQDGHRANRKQGAQHRGILERV